MNNYRAQHQSLLQFGGTFSLLKAKMSDDEKLAIVQQYWKPGDFDMMAYWLMVAYDPITVPFEPIPFEKGTGGVFKENPVVTPMELVDLLAEELNHDEALAILDEMSKSMFRPACDTFRLILSRDLSKLFVGVELAGRIVEWMGTA